MINTLIPAVIAAGFFLAVVIAIILLRTRANDTGNRPYSYSYGSRKTPRRLQIGIFAFGIIAGLLVGAVIGYFLILKPQTTEMSPTTSQVNLSPTASQEIMPTTQSQEAVELTATVTVGPTITPLAGIEGRGDGPAIRDITTNLATYAGAEIPQFEKFEITFQVDTTAQNLQLPFDETPPPGLEPGLGISVDAHFTPDNWQTEFIQPAFYYQEFEDEIKADQMWLYPTDNFAWKVRFAPDRAGTWQFKLIARDASGLYETGSFGFEVAPSANKGFLKVSETDPRYFEFQDGTYFPGLGYNADIPTDPGGFETMAGNGIQLIRTWLPSQLSIFGSAWSPWQPFGAAPQAPEPNARLSHDAAPPFNLTLGVDPPLARPGSELFLWLSHDETEYRNGVQWNFVPCAVWGWQTPKLPVKPNTDYRLRVRYREEALAGPKIADRPYGFVVKTGGWLWGEFDEMRCYHPDVGRRLAASYSTTDDWSTYADPDYEGWQILEGQFNSGNRNFLNNLYLAIENASAGHVLVDYVWLEEKLANDQYGPNIIHKPWMAHHLYFEQRGSFAFDKTVEQASQAGIYLKLVILEKNDAVLNMFQTDGSLSPVPPDQNPARLFFGQGREREGKTKIRWLQEAWWRYLQARWGYSPHIHSWELLNEGDPDDVRHYILTDEMGKYFQRSFIPPEQQAKHPNMHLVTTSFWNSFPLEFWGGQNAPFVDYADVHHYAQESNVEPLNYIYELDDFYDAALFSQKLSQYHGAKAQFGPGKPVVRGETGFLFDRNDPFSQNRTNGLWLHNFTWAGINAGGLIELLWTGAPIAMHIYRQDSHDHRPVYRTYFNFIKDIPLNNGHYQDAEATSSQTDLRVWGQKDLVNGQAHLWIQNKKHTWKNVLDGAPIPPVSGTVMLPGLEPGQSYLVEWWDTYQADPSLQIIRTETMDASSDGSIEIPVEELDTDIAVKIASP